MKMPPFNQLLEQYGMIPPGSTVLCAVSGGADSVFLLHRLYHLRCLYHFTLYAAHFNHRLRGKESDRDEAFVRSFVAGQCPKATVCSHEGTFVLPPVELFVGSGDVAGEAARTGRGIEETAREMRYAFLRRTAASLGGALIATAHTADDNAETILLHLARGSGLRGLTGIRPVGNGLIRPMLTTTRREVEEYLRIYGLPHVEDSSNTDEAFARNRLRRRVMPLLEELSPGFAERCGETAALLRTDEDYLTAQAARAVAGVEERDGELRLPAAALSALPDALAPRAARLLLARLRGGDTDLAAAHLLGVVGLCRGDSPSARLSLPGGLTARREYGTLVLTTRSDPDPCPVCPLAMPGETALGEFRAACRPVVYHGEPQEPWHFWLRRDCTPLMARPRREGDRLSLPGRGSRTVKKLMIDRKLPRPLRPALPVLEREGSLAAVGGLGPHQDYLPQPGQPAWEITITPPSGPSPDTGEKGQHPC